MQYQFNTLSELHALRVYAFPTQQRRNLRVVRTDGTTLVGVNSRGRIFVTLHATAVWRRFSHLTTFRQTAIIDGLNRLGLVNPSVFDEITAAAKAEEIREEARYQLGQADDLEKLGVPYTKTQLRKLRELAGVQS